MNGLNMKKTVMLTVSEYKEMNSISNLILVGKNLERVDCSKAVKMLADGAKDIDVLLWFMKEYLKVVSNTNNIDFMSLAYMEHQKEFTEYYQKAFVNVLTSTKEFDNLISRPIADPEYFGKVIEICGLLSIATEHLIYNQTDVFTVNVLTIMNIVNMLGLQDEDLNYILLKVIGRKNESRASDVDNWLEQIDHDYELFHYKNVMDHVLDLASVSPRMVLDLTVYRSLITPEVSELCDFDSLDTIDTTEELDRLLEPVIDHIVDTAVETIESLARIVNTHKYTISSYYLDLFEKEFANLGYYKIVPNLLSETATMYSEDVKESEEDRISEDILVKEYKPHVKKQQLRADVKIRVCEYLIKEGIIVGLY